MNTLGARIRTTRKAMKLSQTDLGKALANRLQRPKAFSVGTVLGWEKGDSEPSLDAIFAMGQMAHVSAAWLAFGDLAYQLTIDNPTITLRERYDADEANGEFGRHVSTGADVASDDARAAH